MNNKQLNREFTQTMRDRNKFNSKKTGLTDSEEEESTSKSLKSPKSNISGRSSLLSARSPREDNLLSTQKRGLKNTAIRKISPENFSDDEIPSSPRKTRFGQEKSMSPKSPRSSDRSEGNSLPRFNRRNDSDDRITPRSSRSDKDDLNNLNMLSTMRKPLNDNAILSKTIKRAENFDVGKAQIGTKTASNVSLTPKIRAATPTKLSLAEQQRQQQHHQSLSPRAASQRRMISANRYENDLNEEDFNRSAKNSGRSTPTYLSQRKLSSKSQSPTRSPRSPKSTGRSVSPRDSLDVNEEFERDKNAYLNHAKKVDILMNSNNQNIHFNETYKKDVEIEELKKRGKSYENLEKDPQVIESIEDSRTAEKLQKQREEKRLEREKRAKNQTESTKKIEEAIEKVENTMQDSIRLDNLKGKSSELKYPTKPILNETKLLNVENKGRLGRSMSARERSTRRSSSANSRFERTVNDKYAHIQPKTQTRLPLQTARTSEEEYNNNKNNTRKDSLNDSSSIRESIYNEWYQKKMQHARQKLRENISKQKDSEEKNVQEHILKYEKSEIELKKWLSKKEEDLKRKKEQTELIKKKKQNEIYNKKMHKQAAAKAFEEWVKIIAIREQEKKEESLKNEFQNEKQKRKEKEKEKKSEKPPLPFDAWSKKKEEILNEKLNSEREKELKKRQKEKEKEERKRLAEISYEEWLDKKEREEENKPLNKSLSSSMTALPPFYPTSKTISFGR